MNDSTDKKIIHGKIISNTPVCANYFEMEIQAPWIAKKSSPGKFITVQIQTHTTDPLLKIPLAIHDTNNENISLLYRVVGAGTTLLSERHANETITLLGPLGNGFDLNPIIQNKNLNVIIVAGGCGIAPLYLLSKSIAENTKNKIDFFIGVKTKDEIICEEKLKALNIKNIHIVTEDGSQGYQGYVTDCVKEHIQKTNEPLYIFGSGPSVMLDILREYSCHNKIPTQLSFESYMACGIGACLGCVVKFPEEEHKLCCKDGPIFKFGHNDSK